MELEGTMCDVPQGLLSEEGGMNNYQFFFFEWSGRTRKQSYHKVILKNKTKPLSLNMQSVLPWIGTLLSYANSANNSVWHRISLQIFSKCMNKLMDLLIRCQL